MVPVKSYQNPECPLLFFIAFNVLIATLWATVPFTEINVELG